MNIVDFNFYYKIFYIMLCAVVLPFSIVTGISSSSSRNIKAYSLLYSAFFIILIFFMVGLRGVDVGVDTKHYYLYYWLNSNLEYSTEIIFPFLIATLKYFNLSYQSFLLLVSFVFYFYLNEVFNKSSLIFKANKLFLIFCFFSLFISLSLSINVIRQGVSLVFLWYGIMTFMENKNKKVLLFFILLSFLTHSTSIIAVILLFAVYFIRNINLFFYVLLYFLGIMLSYLDFGVLNIVGDTIVIEDRRVSYLTNESLSYEVGFKLQFVLFNTLFLFIFIYFLKNIEFINRYKYEFLLKYYIILSLVFFLSFQIPYSDRIGLFSWIMLPILMAPVFTSRYRYSFLFIIFMVLVYVGFNLYAK